MGLHYPPLVEMVADEVLDASPKLLRDFDHDPLCFIELDKLRGVA